jgi:hypothetical protein
MFRFVAWRRLLLVGYGAKTAPNPTYMGLMAIFRSCLNCYKAPIQLKLADSNTLA